MADAHAGTKMLAYQLWRHLCALASQDRAGFALAERGGSVGWLWRGPLDRLLARAAPGADTDDLTRAGAHLQSIRMLREETGKGPPSRFSTWFVSTEWRGLPPADESVTTPHAALSDPVGRAGALEETSRRLLTESQRLTRQNRRLRDDNSRLRAGSPCL